MKSGKPLALALVVIAAIAFAARAELTEWVQHQPAGTALDALLRSMPLPGGAVRFPLPPAEARQGLTKLISADARNAAIYRLRAQEAELQLDFTAAETDWRAYADLAADRGAGYLELADFYHRRVRAADEIAALDTVGRAPSGPFLPAPEQRAWQAYARMVPVIHDAGLPVASSMAAFRSWIARYPKEQTPRREFVSLLVERKQFAAAQSQIDGYARAFPDDTAYPVEARANLAARRDSDDAALRVYDRSFQPLWPKELLEAYFALLEKNSQARDFVARARTARDKNPGDIDAAARLFAYDQHSNNMPAARRALLEYRLAKEQKPGSWMPAELRTLAGLFERLPDANEQARAYYALYSAPGASAGDREEALAGMTGLLLTKPDQPIRFGAGDLSLYKDIATADSSPGFLNGILSLVLNSTSPRYQYQQQSGAATAYFHRAEGAQLLDVLEKQFPASRHRAALRASLVDAYANYGDDDGVIAAGRAFLAAFPRASERTHVALALADALARRQRTQEEFAVYQQMLTELASRAGNVPLGVHGGAAPETQPENAFGHFFPRGFQAEPVPQNSGPRSSDYATVLDRYLARVAEVGQPMEALRIYRRELDRNPDDPGLYERFAAFLEQNNLGADVQDIYRRAIAKFPDRSWHHRLARWYLRGRQTTQLTAISQEVTKIFTGTELESYFGDLVQRGAVGPQLYLQLNLYAHQRFPEDLVFVHNLLNAYNTEGTVDTTAARALLHDYWFCDAELKRQYFEDLSSRGELLNQLAALRHDHPEIQNNRWQQLAAANPAAAQFNAEAEVWLGHYEAAAPALRAVADLYTGSPELDATASSLYRSLAAYFPVDTEVAATFAQRAYDSAPRDTKPLETVGDVYSDHDQFARAAMAWNAIPAVFPGKPDGYLESATVFWDYYRFNDARRLIGQARVKYRDNALFAYEAGAIAEGQRDYTRAVTEYLAGWGAGNGTARNRIVRLASRPAQRDLVYRLTANADDDLRIDVLKAQQRRPELEAFLSKQIAVSTQLADLGPLLDAAREQGFDAVERQGREREIAVALDPVERMRIQIDFVKYLEAHKDLPAATRVMDALDRDNPRILGVVRARVDFDKRNQRNDDAVAALLEAASNSRADLSAQFRFEAAGIATRAGHIDQARALLTDLLHADPWRPAYLAQMAETYDTAHDDAGFGAFASTQIDALKKASLPPDDRNARIASLRRRLIVTLARRSDYAGAVDQYIEVVNRYPEDQAVTREAALFASAHGRRDQLIAFYRKTVADAPRDWRWPIVLARIETALEDYPAALDAYAAAMKARPDRADIVQARAQLEERLLRFDDAIASYTLLYRLTYNDPQWLDKAAEFQARLGRTKEAIATLERAHIGAGGENVTSLFAIAEKLDEWHLYAEAAPYAERGFALAGYDILEKYSGEANIYAKIMAEARHTNALLGLEVINHYDPRRLGPLRTAGAAIAELYTPEEKAALAAKLQSDDGGRALAESAGLTEFLAQSLYRAWTNGDTSAGTQWIALQRRRGLYEQLSRDLEAIGANPHSTTMLQQAADAAADAGDIATELRLYAASVRFGLPDRYLSLLAAHDPKTLVDLAPTSDHAVQFAIGAENPAFAMDAVRARARSLPPVWLSAYTALTGIYLDDRSPAVNQAFLAALAPATIGQRLARPHDANRALAGSIWYYYGARYGEYLARSGTRAAADYLSSETELHPGDPEAYLDLARFYADRNLSANAIAEFRKTLDLDPDRGEAHDGIARALLHEDRRTEAVAEWREAIAAFQREQSRGVRVRETFWSNVAEVFRAVGDAKAFPELQPDIHRLLADYVHRNGGYRVQELIGPALEQSLAAGAGFDWLLDVLLETNNAEIFIPNLSAEDQERFARFRLAYEQREAAVENGYDKERFEQESRNSRIGLIDLLLTHGKAADALAEWRQFTPEELEANRSQFTAIEIRLAAATGTLDQLISRYKTDPSTAPQAQQLLLVSTTLRTDGHVPEALALLEFAYTLELDNQNLDITNFLGLARVYLERGDTGKALAALRRMTLVAGDPFEAFEPAAGLLIEFHCEKEATEFLAKAVQATPWDAQAKLQLARISHTSAAAIVDDSAAPYDVRADAARLVAPARLSGGGELALLASGDRTPGAARQPFFVESRWIAAAGIRDKAERLGLLREALAIAPGDQRIRLDTVRAALDAGGDSLALAMMRAPTWQYGGEPPVNTNDAALLESLAGAAERLGDFPEAERYLDQTRGLLSAPADRQRVAQKRVAVVAEQKRRQENLNRQPIISEKLEQPHVVRPREMQ